MRRYSENSSLVFERTLVAIKDSIPKDVYIRLEELIKSKTIHDEESLKSIFSKDSDEATQNGD